MINGRETKKHRTEQVETTPETISANISLKYSLTSYTLNTPSD